MLFSARGMDASSKASPTSPRVEPFFVNEVNSAPTIGTPTRSQSRIPVKDPDGDVVGL